MKAEFVPTMVGMLSLLSACCFFLMYLLVKAFFGDEIRSVDVQRRQARRQLEHEEDAALLRKFAASTFEEAVVLSPSGNSTTGAEMRQWLQAQEQQR